MIEHGWRTGLSPSEGAELASMLDEIALEDGEVSLPEIVRPGPAPADAPHLLVWTSADTGDRHRSTTPSTLLAACLRVEPVSAARPARPGSALAHYVVRPQLRSLGVTTLLLEELGPFGGAGWLGPAVPELRIWARGDHPAAARVARRFHHLGVREGDRRSALVAPLGRRRAERQHGDEHRSHASVRPPADDREVLLAAELWRASGTTEPLADTELLVLPAGTGPVGAIWFDLNPIEMTEYGVAGRIEGVAVDGAAAPPTAWTGLLRAALDRMRERGRAAAVVTAPAGENALLTSARLLGFEHRRTDVEYLISA